MKKTIWLLVIGTITMTLFNFFLLYKNGKLTDRIDTAEIGLLQSNTRLRVQETESVKILNPVLLTYKLENEQLTNIKLTQISSQEGESNKISTVGSVLARKKIIFRFFSSSCSSCIIEQFKILNLLSKQIGRNKIAMITDINTNELDMMLLSLGISLDLYVTGAKTFLSEFDKNEVPYLFVGDEAMQIRRPFVLTMESTYLSKHFYQDIEKKFF